MHSNIHRDLGESAGIVDTALCVVLEGRGFQSLQRILFFILFAPRPEYCSKHNFFIIFSSCCIKVKRAFHETYPLCSSFVDLLWVFLSVLCLLCLCVRLFICALWLPAGKGLNSWLWFVVSNCEFVTFPLVSRVRCGT